MKTGLPAPPSGAPSPAGAAVRPPTGELFRERPGNGACAAVRERFNADRLTGMTVEVYRAATAGRRS